MHITARARSCINERLISFFIYKKFLFGSMNYFVLMMGDILSNIVNAL